MDQPSDPMRLDVALTERLQDYAAARGIDLQEAFETALGECRSAPRDGEELGTTRRVHGIAPLESLFHRRCDHGASPPEEVVAAGRSPCTGSTIHVGQSYLLTATRGPDRCSERGVPSDCPHRSIKPRPRRLATGRTAMDVRHTFICRYFACFLRQALHRRSRRFERSLGFSP